MEKTTCNVGEQLQWLKGHMPEGWRIEDPTAPHRVMLLNERDGGFELWPLMGDIGLAPLTILLKQELIRSKGWTMVEGSDDGWSISHCESQGINLVVTAPTAVAPTEFEAVFSAYREKVGS